MKKSVITEEAIEETLRMSNCSDVRVRLAGTRWGPSFADIERMFVDAITDYKNKLPRCTRNARFNSAKRLANLPKD